MNLFVEEDMDETEKCADLPQKSTVLILTKGAIPFAAVF